MRLPLSLALKNTHNYYIIMLICIFHTLGREGGPKSFEVIPLPVICRHHGWQETVVDLFRLLRPRAVE